MNRLDMLKDENSGYNPEEVNLGEDSLIIKNENIILTNNVDKTEAHYNKTNCKNEKEYIENFPFNYGVVYNGMFYRQL